MGYPAPFPIAQEAAGICEQLAKMNEEIGELKKVICDLKETVVGLKSRECPTCNLNQIASRYAQSPPPLPPPLDLPGQVKET